MEQTTATTVRALLARADLHLRLALDEAELEPGALDAPGITACVRSALA